MLERLLGTFPDVIQLLRDDHKLVRSLFALYAKARNGEKPQIAHQDHPRTHHPRGRGRAGCLSGLSLGLQGSSGDV